MKRTIFLAGLLTTIFFGANAQTTPAPTTNPATVQPQNSQASRYPYMGQGTYSNVEPNSVPQNIRTNFGTDYSGVSTAKWESNNDVYRSSFLQDGRNMSVLYGQDGRVMETRTGMQVTDLPASVQTSLNGKNAASPYEIKVGNDTYYSAQIGGREMYYGTDGKAVKIPKQRK